MKPHPVAVWEFVDDYLPTREEFIHYVKPLIDVAENTGQDTISRVLPSGVIITALRRILSTPLYFPEGDVTSEEGHESLSFSAIPGVSDKFVN